MRFFKIVILQQETRPVEQVFLPKKLPSSGHVYLAMKCYSSCIHHLYIIVYSVSQIFTLVHTVIALLFFNPTGCSCIGHLCPSPSMLEHIAVC